MLALEVALPAGAIAFYVYDSLLLLYDNEVIFVRRGSAWALLPESQQIFFGRRVAAPGLLAPWAVVLRAFWSRGSEGAERGGAGQASSPADRVVAALLPLRCLCTAMLFVLLVALPAVALLRGAGLEMLALFALMYALIVACLVVLAIRRRSIGLDAKGWWLIALDGLACAPFAVNFVAKTIARIVPPVEALEFASLHCAAVEQQKLRALRERRLAGTA